MLATRKIHVEDTQNKNKKDSKNITIKKNQQNTQGDSKKGKPKQKNKKTDRK